MRWEDVDRAFPVLPWPAPSGNALQLAQRQIDASLTYLARTALGLPAAGVLPEQLTAAMQDSWQTRMVLAGHARTMLDVGAIALVAAHEHAWDLVAAVTGGAMLPGRVLVKKTFADSVAGLARHLATAARARLPAANVVAAMDEARGQFAVDRIDGRVALIAARIFVRDIVAATDVVADTKRWFAGEPLAIEVSRAPRAVADGEDARVTIFERYAPELADDAAIDGTLRQLLTAEPWGRHLEHARKPLEDAVIRAFIARRPLPAGWDAAVDPIVASWLGVAESPAIKRRVADLKLLAGGMQLDRGWDEPVKALAFGKADRVARLTGGGTLPAFTPGKFFKDDGRKLLRYVAAAVLAGANATDVEPAWLDFLARRSPATTPMLERAQLHWWHLLAIQCVATHELGKAPRESTGRALQRIVTGV